MAARFLDMALDDVAKSRASNNRSPAGRRGGRGGGGRDSPINRSNRSSPYQVKHNMREFKMESTWHIFAHDLLTFSHLGFKKNSAQTRIRTIVGLMTSLKEEIKKTTTREEAALGNITTAVSHSNNLKAMKEMQRSLLRTCTMPLLWRISR